MTLKLIRCKNARVSWSSHLFIKLKNGKPGKCQHELRFQVAMKRSTKLLSGFVSGIILWITIKIYLEVNSDSISKR